jgi:hypothetical protein
VLEKAQINIPKKKIEEFCKDHRIRKLSFFGSFTTEILNQAVKRHKDRFPEDFMFQLTMEEAKIWRTEVRGGGLRSQIIKEL